VRPTTPSWLRFTHRPPIDGLRAVAALLVVLFHAQMPGFANGYVGVDVFFVLSGYLITSLLLRERLGEGRIHLRAFYARRARRLLPAALTVLLVTAVAYAVTASAFDVLQNRLGFVFAALYVSNWYFLSQSSDYFAQDASPSPVLHYWSLSVEEQFYLVWPVLLIGLLAIPAVRRRLGPWVLGGITLIATVASGLVAGQHRMLAYFGTFGRAYQLLLGATLAAGVLWWSRRAEEDPAWNLGLRARGAGRFLVPAGLVALLVAGSDLGPDSPWTTGLVGCLATVAVLAGIELVPTGRIQSALSARVPQLLGRWSYSIYLWHWPVIVIALTMGVLPGHWWLRVPLVVGLTVLLARLTWFLVEGRALRIKLRTLPRQRAVVVGGVLLTVVTAVVSQRVLQVPASAEALHQQVGAGSGDDASGGGDDSGTSVSDSTMSGGRTVLLVGDSHVVLWKQGLASYGKDHDLRVVTVATRGCPWLDVEPDWGDIEDPHCASTLHQASIEALKKYHPDVTILGSRSIDVRTLKGPHGDLAPDEPGWADLVRAGATSYLDAIAPYTKHIVLIEPLPETPTNMSVCLGDPHRPGQCDQHAKLMPGMAAVERIYRDLDAASSQVTSVSLDDLICPGGKCPAEVGGIPTHRDTNHLTIEYATRLVPAFLALLRMRGISP
jgi:peptidoglycan/LPS O-acetylase OafA/YrhL